MAENAVEDEIARALQQELGRDVHASDSLDALGIDSLRMAQLATELESRFGFRIDEKLFDVETVEDLIEYVRARSKSL
ncbi:MAG: acyl carrier protein [Gammaproteobacteria bacterium]|nr:acyl carrier protein [Gammaproteobacteria bacterium]NIV48391.1 acyl carrier protein [Gammaproteobacteria bacterium]NIW56022.1 acyl carrier protein [Gammaproteobacteria bacterium]NIX04993.1 acyl carrier protein [Gammaproteobacteria bacterium]